MISFFVYLVFLIVIFGQFLTPLKDYLTRVWIALHLPGPKTKFPFGNCFTLRDPDVLKKEFARGYSLYGTFGRIWLMFFPFFVILHPDDVQTVLATKKHTEKMFLYKFLHNFLGKGLITSERERWQWHRKYLQPYFHLGILEKFIENFEKCAKRGLIEEINDKNEAFNVTPIINKCVLNILNDIIDEACTMMLAGQDSTGSALAFLMYYLAENEDFQQKCFLEVEKIFKEKSFDESLTLTDLNNMRFLEMCIKETLRLQPSIIIYGRKLSEPVTLRNVTLPAGSDVFIIPYATHRIPEIYPEPEKFDPERFNVENSQNRSKFAFIPFSAGPRNCIGYQFAIMEMKVIMATILKDFRIKSVPGITKIEPSFRITVRARGGIWLKMEKRT
ncbi:probable cytochrome P450 4aa1 [Culicoides brevitarsis]|uniref:probable cytochrome P450 4aa1 n=1 Tax=Culicoides brevitarsis TaxID=469753 RepID=UPI00307C6343